MKLGLKIILPLLLFLLVILGSFGYLLYNLKQQETVISEQKTRIQRLNSLNERLVREQDITVYNVLAYRFNQDKASLLLISQAELDKAKTLDEIFPFIISPRGRELIVTYINSRKEVESLRNELIKAIDDGDKARINLAYNRWSIQVQNIKVAQSDIGAYNINSLEKTLAAVGVIRDTIVKTVIILAFLVIAIVIFLYIYLRIGITQPIIKLAGIADQLANADFTTTTDIQSHDEVGQLARSFNKMADNLKQSYSSLENKVVEKTIQLTQKVNQLEEDRAKDKAILESIGDGLVATDGTGAVAFVNRWAELLVGYRHGELIGQKWEDRVSMLGFDGKPVPVKLRPSVQVLRSGEKLSSRGNFYVRVDGKKFPVAITSSPVILQGKVIGAVTVFRDITSELETEKAKDEFLAIASHELRTPLTVISGNSSMLLDKTAKVSAPVAREILMDIFSESKRLISLVGNFLDVSKINLNKISLEIRSVDLRELTAKTVSEMEPIAKEKGLNLVYTRPKRLPRVLVDEGKVKQVLTNLLANAIIYTPKGKIEVSQGLRDGLVETVVTDTGQGIAGKEQTLLFKEFTPLSGGILTRKSGSTGLGLYISKELVEKMGGKLYLIRSLPGKGSSFGFSLKTSISSTKADLQ